MAGEYRSILDGLILILTIVFWNYGLDWLTLRSKTIEKFTYPPVPLFRNTNGPAKHEQTVCHRRAANKHATDHGIDELADVKAVFLEGSGHVSVIPAESEDNKGEADDRQKRKIR